MHPDECSACQLVLVLLLVLLLLLGLRLALLAAAKTTRSTTCRPHNIRAVLGPANSILRLDIPPFFDALSLTTLAHHPIPTFLDRGSCCQLLLLGLHGGRIAATAAAGPAA
jgi:hypothetical protein